MIPLPETFKVKGQRGHTYSQVKREGDVVIAEQFDKELERILAYEVFVVQKYPDRMSPDGKTFIPAKEAPPRSESWGLLGCSCVSLEAAEIRFQEFLTSGIGQKKTSTIQPA